MPVNTPSDKYDENKKDWSRIRDVLSGSGKIKDAGRRYLPSLDGMEFSEYEAYKQRAQFFNASKRTVDGLVGQVFRKPPEVILGEAEILRENLDKCTNDLQSFDTFARHVFREVLEMGRNGVLVDAPAGGGKPYFATYSPEHIINWRMVKTEDNRIIANQIILCEHISVERDDGFGSETVEIYRELFLDGDNVYNQRVYYPTKKNGMTTYVAGPNLIPRDGYGMIRGEIPFTCTGPSKIGLPVQQSPILDIVELNVLHYQRCAQLAQGQFYTATPTYWALAPQGEQKVEYRIGPNTVWLIEEKGAAGILEYTGSGLQYLENACTQLEAQMAGLGARLVTDRKNTAAEASDVAVLRSEGEAATLYEITDTVEQALTEALKSWVVWHGRSPKGVAVKLNRDFVRQPLEYRLWLQLDRAHTAGDIDDETYYRILYEGDVFYQGFTPNMIPDLIAKAKAKKEEIKAQEEKNMRLEASLKPKPAASSPSSK